MRDRVPPSRPGAAHALTHKRTTLEPAEIARYASDRFARECDVLMENAKSRAEYAQRYSDSAFAQWARKQEANLSC